MDPEDRLLVGPVALHLPRQGTGAEESPLAGERGDVLEDVPVRHLALGAQAEAGEHPRAQPLEHLDQPGRLFLLFPLGPVEPAGGLVAHDQGDLAAHVELAGAVGVVVGPLLVPRPVGGDDG